MLRVTRNKSLPGYHARELQGDNSETADVNSEPSLFIRISLALVNTEHPG
jgi:hypothetical protein